MAAAHLRTATTQDADSIRALLAASGLPTSDLVTAQPEFVVACAGTDVVGAGALQRFGAAALLRSVAVVPDLRGTGLGRLLVQELERRARAAQVRELLLLTETAKDFFQHQGYSAIVRQAAPQALQATDEFRTLCPVSATCMRKAL